VIAQIDTLGSFLGLLELTPYDRPFVRLQAQVISDLMDISGYISSLTLEHMHSAYRTKLSVSRGPILKTSGVTGTETLGVGWDLGFDFVTNRFISYNFAVFLKGLSSRLVLKHESNNRKEYTVGDLVVSGYYPLNSITRLAGEVRLGSDKLLHSEVGVMRDLSENTSIKLKVTDKKMLSTGLMCRVSTELAITGGMDVDLTSGNEVGMGLGVKWTL
jgi:hypothetical protein